MKKVTVGKKKEEALPLEERPDQEIIFRHNLVRGAIKLLKTDPRVKDQPWTAGSILHYKEQLKTLGDELIRRGLLQPVTVELDSLEIQTRPLMPGKKEQNNGSDRI